MSDGESGRRIIDGRFELEARLGGGGMGTVWRARDVVLDRAVALKEVRPSDPGLAEFDPQGAALLRARVLREARALARVDHPNVVTIHHVVDGGEHTYPWLVMELVTGGSLQDRLGKGPLTPVAAARLGREVLAALRAAHDVGIQHRDVKPANVLLRPDHRPVLTDFGIAAIRESTALTATGSIIGTPDYMAPERIARRRGRTGLRPVVARDDALRRRRRASSAAQGNDPGHPGGPAQRGTPAAAPGRCTDRLPEGRPGEGSCGPGGRGDGGPDARGRVRRAGHDVASSRPGRRQHLVPARTPVGVAPTHLPVVGSGPAPGVGTPTGFGPPTPRDAVPGSFAAPTAGPESPTRPVRGQGGRARTWVTIASSVVGTVLAGVLVWTLLPDGTHSDRGDTADAPEASSSRTKGPTSGPPRPSRSATAPRTDTKADLLTPAGIRTAVEAIKAATGADRAGDLAVYEDHVSADIMVKGSETKCDSYTYRPDRGVEKDIISGSLTAA